MANDHIAVDRKKVRLIDANEFWNRLSHVVYDIFTVHEKDGQLTGTASVGYYTETIEEVLKQTKTVDAVEVVHAKWGTIRNFGGGECYGWCSNCKTPVKADNATGLVQNNRFCHWCGAKMDGGTNNG